MTHTKRINCNWFAQGN